MSNYLVISVVTEVLKYILREIEEVSDDLEISMMPPHTIGSDQDKSGLNIFLYHVTLNSGYANYDLPLRDARGKMVSRPLVGLNLHYLLTPYSSNNDDILTQQILGSTIRILHENSIITRQIIEQTLKPIRDIDPTNKILNSDLSEQKENVKLVYQPLSVDDITKLWSSYFQTNYRLSIAYLATLVLIDSKKEPIYPLPVQDRKIFVKQFRYPIIDRIEPNIMHWDTNMTINIKGKNLNSNAVKVIIGEAEITSDFLPEFKDQTLTVIVPNDLSAGIKNVKVVHGITDDENVDSNSQHLEFESNTSSFTLSPLIITKFQSQIVKGTNLDLDFKPPLRNKQKVDILIGEKVFPQPSRPPQTSPIETITINTNNFPIGKSLFRLRIDGAESPLERDLNPLSPLYKKYVGPQIDVIEP
jgi:Pvc16 N-terminal domain/IPT/TIG domain